MLVSVFELLTPQTISSTGNENSVKQMSHYSKFVFELVVSSIAQASSSTTLDVFVQAMLPSGTWVDIVHFTQLAGDDDVDPALQFVAKTVNSEPQAMFEIASALAAGSVRHIFSDEYRVRWVVANEEADFDIAVRAIGIN